MQKTIILFLFLVATTFNFGCNKDDDDNGGTNNSGCTLVPMRFTNTSDNPYNLFIDGTFKKQMSGNTEIVYELEKGVHTAKAEQVSGYVFYPTIVNKNFTLSSCQEQGWIFP
ncbi:MAG: hypothetical protein IPL35_01060 [Sphingobacteriales bacterium]|nr:hypothetical protein [Sphingobacteriales bacterium]